MKKIFLLGITICLQTILLAQDVAELQRNAKAYMQKGDHANAILILNRALVLQPGNLELSKDLGLKYYYAKEYVKAIDVIKPLLDRNDADDQCFQIAGDSYWAIEQFKDCEKVYKKGIKK